jgi:hypothetical protein
MHVNRRVPLLGLLALGASLTPHLSAQPNYRQPPRPGSPIRCESRNNGRNYGAADSRGGVTLVLQVSEAQCVQGRTWGFDARGFPGDPVQWHAELGESGTRAPSPKARRSELGQSRSMLLQRSWLWRRVLLHAPGREFQQSSPWLQRQDLGPPRLRRRRGYFLQ